MQALPEYEEQNMRKDRPRTSWQWAVWFGVLAVAVMCSGGHVKAAEVLATGLPVFEDLDTNVDGFLSLEEFLAAPELDEAYFIQLDVNSDGSVSKEEWPKPSDEDPPDTGAGMNIEQTLSDQAQMTTIAFDALAFLM